MQQRNGRNNAYAGAAVFRKICAFCGKEFTCQQSSTLYCSHRCSCLAYKQRKKDERHRMAEKHCRKIDLELYVESGKLDIARTRDLVKTGANCDAEIPTDKFGKVCAYWNIEEDCLYLFNECGLPGAETVYIDFYHTCKFDSFLALAGYDAILAIFNGWE